MGEGGQEEREMARERARPLEKISQDKPLLIFLPWHLKWPTKTNVQSLPAVSEAKN